MDTYVGPLVTDVLLTNLRCQDQGRNKIFSTKYFPRTWTVFQPEEVNGWQGQVWSHIFLCHFSKTRPRVERVTSSQCELRRLTALRLGLVAVGSFSDAALPQPSDRHPPTGQTSKPNFWDLNPLAPPNPIFYPKTIQQKPQTVKHLSSIKRNSSYLVSCDTYNLGPMFQAKPHPQTLTRFQMWNPCKAPTPSPPRITTQQEWAGFWRMWNVYGPFRIYSSRKWWAGGSVDEKELRSHIESGGWLALLRKPRDSLAPVELVEPMDVGEDA